MDEVGVCFWPLESLICRVFLCKSEENNTKAQRSTFDNFCTSCLPRCGRSLRRGHFSHCRKALIFLHQKHFWERLLPCSGATLSCANTPSTQSNLALVAFASLAFRMSPKLKLCCSFATNCSLVQFAYPKMPKQLLRFPCTM